jgi:DNA-binding CsgD family transcriptional regulator
MRLEEEGLRMAIEKFYDAGLGLGTWQDAVDYLNTLLPSVAFALYGQDMTLRASLGAVQAGLDPRAAADFNAYYASVNVWGEGFARSPVGTLLHSDAFLPREELFASEYYNDWLIKQDNMVSGWGSLLRNEQGRFLALSSTMRARDEEIVSPAVRQLIVTIMPHVDRAMQLARLLGGGSPMQSLAVMVEHVADAAFVLDARGGIACANAGGRRLLADPGLFHPAVAAIRFSDPVAQSWLETGLAELAAGGRQQASNTMRARGRADTHAECGLWPLAEAQRTDPAPIAHFMVDRPTALLVVRYTSPGLLHDLWSHHGLTHTETVIAGFLTEGRSLRDIAGLRGTSIHTVRNQVRALFEKLGVQRQSELVAKLLQSRQD